MAIPTFLICSAQDSPETENKILEIFGGDDDNAYIVRQNSQWLVSSDMTTKQVYEKIELAGEDKISVVVFLIGSYWGHHKKDMWEWLELD